MSNMSAFLHLVGYLAGGVALIGSLGIGIAILWGWVTDIPEDEQ